MTVKWLTSFPHAAVTSWNPSIELMRSGIEMDLKYLKPP